MGNKRTIVDPATGKKRPAGYGDVAVLVTSTFNLPLLFPELDRLDVPYAARGGSLFLGDALHRQFLLGLRALADRDDGVAQAALLRPPFFALDYDDLARERAADQVSKHPGVLRARAALEMVRDLRRRRLDRSPGSTARDLLERTAFARAAALGPNGAQRLEALRELCLALDAVAAEGLDFDAATAPRPERKSRFGRVFGDTVHLAIGLALRDPALASPAAVARAAAATGLAEHGAEAAEDVARALAALEKAGLRRAPGPDLQLEYPVAQARNGRLLVGYVDLLAADKRGLAVIDFKTDAPPAGDVAATHAAYVEQVRSYARMLEELGVAAAGTVRAGLLFTAEQEVRWVTRS
jgi:ATP-dependent exoDNAse (exonuclease V) beta subunit